MCFYIMASQFNIFTHMLLWVVMDTKQLLVCNRKIERKRVTYKFKSDDSPRKESGDTAVIWFESKFNIFILERAWKASGRRS